MEHSSWQKLVKNHANIIAEAFRALASVQSFSCSPPRKRQKTARVEPCVWETIMVTLAVWWVFVFFLIFGYENVVVFREIQWALFISTIFYFETLCVNQISLFSGHLCRLFYSCLAIWKIFYIVLSFKPFCKSDYWKQ